jgi:hypothetical protein
VRFHRHDEADLTLLFFHGNGEIVSDYDDLASAWRQLGVQLVVGEYRGYGKSSGAPTLRSAVSDAHPILEHVRGACGDTLLAVMGRSLGSAPAIELAAGAPGIAGLIIESGFADPFGLLRRRGIHLTRLEEEDHRTFDNGRKIEGVACPTLVLHGAADDLLSPAEGRALHDSAGAEEKRLVLLPGVGHNDILWGAFEAYFKAVGEFLSTLRGLPSQDGLP